MLLLLLLSRMLLLLSLVAPNALVHAFQQPEKLPQQQAPQSHPNNNIFDYTNYWDNLLLEEHREQVEDLRQRRSTWSRERLYAAGLSIFNACAEPESELFGDKIVRIYVRGEKRLKDKFTRGDVLVMTPNEHYQQDGGGAPRECLVVDVGNDWLTAGVGPSWPKGLYEARKLPGSYRIRLDRTVPRAPLRAQRQALSQLAKERGGEASRLLAHLFLQKDPKVARELTAQEPSRFSSLDGDYNEIFATAMKDAIGSNSFQPNRSQVAAVKWALQRRISLIRGPPGTGKTRVAAALIATSLELPFQSTTTAANENSSCNRVLAVTHSNGAADVLLEALLQLNVPAVRLGRPASVSPSVQHRTVVAISEKLPEVARLRQVAQNPAMHQQSRSAAAFDVKRYMTDVQEVILQSAPVIVTSCIGAHQLVSADESKNMKFPLVVCDESAQTTEPSLICALTAAQAEQIVFVGDTQQLPPTVTTSCPELRSNLGLSPMARLEKLSVGQMTLGIQYRMPKALLEHPARYFYRNLVRCADGAVDRLPPNGFPWPKGQPLAFVQTDTDCEVAHNFGGRSNPTEAKLITSIIHDLLAAGDVLADEISVITPYSKQVQIIRTELSMTRKAHNIRVGTVDSFQGQETGIVLLSAVRSNPLSELGFLRDRRRLCVAITRARRGLILVGDGTALKTCRHWEALLQSCDERGCIMRAADLNIATVNKPETDGRVGDNRTKVIEEALEDLLGGSDDMNDLLV